MSRSGTSSKTDPLQARQWRRVGEFTLFDLSSDHLARRTAVALPEMTDRYLHITLRVQATALRAADLQGVEFLGHLGWSANRRESQS